MRKKILVFITIFALFCAYIFALTGTEILKKVDENIYTSSITYTGRFEIHKEDRTFEKAFKGWAVGEKKSFVKFTNPEDYGVKYLKLDDEMWIAEENDVVKISGHLLKRSVMGSDLSFEDLMKNNKLVELYNVTVTGEEKIDDKLCYILDLEAKSKEAPYKRQKIWVGKEEYIPYKYEYFALSGRLMKTAIVLKTKVIDERNFPVKMKMTNELRKNSYTIFELKDIEIGVEIPVETFSRQNLMR